MKNLSLVQLVLGLWVLVSPWAIGFSGNSTALWSNVIAGLLVALAALWTLFGGKSPKAKESSAADTSSTENLGQ